jgi:hypothetical protein
MMSVTVWILVGYIHWSSGRAALPQSHLYPSKEACEAVLKVTARSYGRATCVQTEVLVPKTPELILPRK